MIQEEVFKVKNMKCTGCSETITKTLNNLKGIKSVETNLDSKDVKISMDTSQITKKEIDIALKQKGYPIS
ncbi:heavy-metal-associated domain-containing protein [Membranihabitans maritimus]|uniref:heavy-metal-associated domain-containing protein n=1 Tax=Membranihabitans maritimus TaxID=2904244 RepID=UPI001F46AF7B|nr:heavy-metal-associated domain-containing protein [Membranihabitans maritimus]